MYAAVRFSLLFPLVGTFFAIAMLLVQPGYAQVARTEVHPLQSMTLTDQEFLTGRQDGRQ